MAILAWPAVAVNSPKALISERWLRAVVRGRWAGLSAWAMVCPTAFGVLRGANSIIEGKEGGGQERSQLPPRAATVGLLSETGSNPTQFGLGKPARA